jgi:hypothetical protein
MKDGTMLYDPTRESDRVLKAAHQLDHVLSAFATSPEVRLAVQTISVALKGVYFSMHDREDAARDAIVRQAFAVQAGTAGDNIVAVDFMRGRRMPQH